MTQRSAIYAYAGDLWRQMKAEYDSALAYHMVGAEQATNGNLLNTAGRAAGVRSEGLFTGSTAHALQYASEELLAYWGTTPRPSLQEYEQQWLAGHTGYQ